MKLEFENGQLTKIDGARPEYMSGPQLIALVRELALLVPKQKKDVPSRSPQRIINEAIRLLEDYSMLNAALDHEPTDNNLTELADLAKALPINMRF